MPEFVGIFDNAAVPLDGRRALWARAPRIDPIEVWINAEHKWMNAVLFAAVADRSDVATAPRAARQAPCPILPHTGVR